ncbi:MAG: hypothetical protein M1829_004539 [Trizodia sp. TS-e1964]|nr:MAG: hypothetical protein M1829_004539 [Trizodia sp. TS-e1964]
MSILNGAHVTIEDTRLSTIDETLRPNINAALLAGGHVDKIQTHLLTHLQRLGWTSDVHMLCVTLMRQATRTPRVEQRGRSISQRRGADEELEEDEEPPRTFNELVARVRRETAEDARLEVPREVVDEGMAFVRKILAEVVTLVEPASS